jgi:translation elongation factor EF-4
MTEVESLSAGEVGYLSAGIKNVKDTRVGDTITHGILGLQIQGLIRLPGSKTYGILWVIPFGK